MNNSGNKERHAALAKELAGRGRELQITTVLFNVGGDIVKSKQTADSLGAPLVDINEKSWRQKVGHYLATYPSTNELKKQFLQTQQEEEESVIDNLRILPVSRHSTSPTSRRASLSSTTTTKVVAPSTPSIHAFDIDEKHPPRVVVPAPAAYYIHTLHQ
jgi:hypothetical protein